jgi:hypothetical protein
MRDTIDMAREADCQHINLTGDYAKSVERLKVFEALVRADQDEKYKWDIHSCGPTCKRYACVAMREAVEAEREACAKVCDALVMGKHCAAAIRARGNT